MLDEVVKAPSGKATDTADVRRFMPLAHFVFIAFFMTCGGPFGLDDAIHAGGILLTVIGVLIFPIVWSLPQALITAELSSMIKVNGGSVVWVWRGLGPTFGMANAYNTLVAALVDLCLYPSKIVAYLPFHLPPFYAYLAKVAILVAATICNAVGLSVVGTASCIMMFVLLSVFIVEIPFAIPLVSLVDYTRMPEQINWALLLSVLLWANSGWDSLSNFAGEVRNPHRTYPLGIALAMLLGMISYLTSILAGYTFLPDPALWVGDAFVAAAVNATGLNTWLPFWVSLSAVFGNLGQLLVCMAATSRQMWAMGADSKEGLSIRTLPASVGRLSSLGTPTSALAIQLAITTVLSIWDFEPLVEFLALLCCIRLTMEFAAFVALKYREPDSERPFVVPFGLVGAWATTGLNTALLVFIFVSVMIEDPLIVLAAVAVNVILLLGAYWASSSASRSCNVTATLLNYDLSIPSSC